MADDLIPLLEQAAGKGDCAARAAWFLKAAQAGNREAMFETGKCYPDSLELAFCQHERNMRTGQDAGKDDF
ncbi:hypothetical protein [Komagataeibacter xylinus]|uniref:hypothetical protein n=1 Tax=Komagataeibacter xylinus TaxID=28448 RepID=UPI00280B7642|nr:hypothetical protein [Komagataeibacter xylinus]